MSRGPERSPGRGAPPLRPFGLVLHHDGRWSHEGQPIRHRRLRRHFDRSVRFLPEEGQFVVTLRHFRGQLEVEEAGFFVRRFEAHDATLQLSDGSREPLDPASLHTSPRDGALLCRVKRELVAEGLLARFDHGAHAELLQAVTQREQGLVLELGGGVVPLPDLEATGEGF